MWTHCCDQDMIKTCSHWVGIHWETASPAWRLHWDNYTEIPTGCVIRQCPRVLCVHIYKSVRMLWIWCPCLWQSEACTFSFCFSCLQHQSHLIFREPSEPLISLYSYRTNSCSISHYRGTRLRRPVMYGLSVNVCSTRSSSSIFTTILTQNIY